MTLRHYCGMASTLLTFEKKCGLRISDCHSPKRKTLPLRLCPCRHRREWPPPCQNWCLANRMATGRTSKCVGTLRHCLHPTQKTTCVSNEGFPAYSTSLRSLFAIQRLCGVRYSISTNRHRMAAFGDIMLNHAENATLPKNHKYFPNLSA